MATVRNLAVGILLLLVLLLGSSPSAVHARSEVQLDTGPAVAGRNLAACRSRVWLTPHEKSGPAWQQHRHWLEAPIPVNGRYVIINMRDYTSYSWNQWGNPNGHAQFGVPTTYALVHFWWKNDAWLLLYNC